MYMYIHTVAGIMPDKRCASGCRENYEVTGEHVSFLKDPEMRAKLILMFVIRRWHVRNILLRSSLLVLTASQGTMTPY